MSGDRQKLLRFSEFIAERKQGETIKPDTLPVMLTFQRKQMLRFSDGKIVAVYREVTTGIEIVFPPLFR